MLYLVKLVISAGMIVLVSEVSKKYAGLGGLLASLPLTSLLGLFWIYFDTGDLARISQHSTSVFWYVLPSLPMFLLLPWLLKKMTFGWAMLFCCVLTMVLYAGMVKLLSHWQLAI
ncbi:MAG: DUF3147 family protein [Candidatus Sericytochromatia bacterium]